MLTPDEAREKAIEQTTLPEEIEKVIDEHLIAAAAKLDDDEPIRDVSIQLQAQLKAHEGNKATLLAAKRKYEEGNQWSVQVLYRPAHDDAQLTFNEVVGY